MLTTNRGQHRRQVLRVPGGHLVGALPLPAGEGAPAGRARAAADREAAEPGDADAAPLRLRAGVRGRGRAREARGGEGLTHGAPSARAERQARKKPSLLIGLLCAILGPTLATVALNA